jgi:hypothetical protein
MALRWTPERLDQLETAVRRGRRIALVRRGTEYVIVPLRIVSAGNQDAVVGRIPMTGEEMTFPLREIEQLQVL